MAAVTQDKGIQGGISNMTPSSLISRVVEDAAVDFGVPVKQGTNDKGCTAGIAAGDLIGITVAEAGKDEFAEDTEARVMTIGVIWVTANATVTAGDVPSYDSGWTTGSGVELSEARYETGGGQGDLVQLRLWGTTAATAA